MSQLLHKILNQTDSIVEEVQTLIKKITNLETDKTKKYFDEITDLVNDYTKIDHYAKTLQIESNAQSCFNCVNTVELIVHIIDRIYAKIEKLMNKTQTSEIYLSQSYISETIELHKKLVIIYKKYNNASNLDIKQLIAELVITETEKLTSVLNNLDLGDEHIIKYVNDAQSYIAQYPFAINLYCQLIDALLKKIKLIPEKKILYFDILALIETDKDRILNLTQHKKENAWSSSLLLNPYYNIFGLIPNTDSISISEVSKLIFDVPASTFSDFVKICKEQQYGLIVINKYIVHPITYNTNHLLDFAKSRVFAALHKPTYGVDISILNRYNTIGKIDSQNKWNFSIDTHVLSFKDYAKEKDMFVIILDSLSPSYYRIMTNYLSTNKKYFVRISSARELYNYCNNSEKLLPTRINNFNTISMNKALQNIYSPIKVDMEKLKEVSTIVDPKYLRNQIYLRLLDRFREILTKKYKGGVGIKDNYTYATIIHDDEFLNIFSNIITEEFHTFLYSTYTDYVSGYINIAEIFTSFLADIYIYQRTFIKEVHDYFKDNLLKFDEDDQPNVVAHFDKMIQTTLAKLITPDSNIYQNILAKINLLKNSLL